MTPDSHGVLPHVASTTSKLCTSLATGLARGCERSGVQRLVSGRLGAMRAPGESYSDVIRRLVELEAKG